MKIKLVIRTLLFVFMLFIPIHPEEVQWHCFVAEDGKDEGRYVKNDKWRTLEDTKKNLIEILTELSSEIKWVYNKDNNFIIDPIFEEIGTLKQNKIYKISHNKILMLLIEQDNLLKPLILLCGFIDSRYSPVEFELDNQIVCIRSSIIGSGGFYTDYIFYVKDNKPELINQSSLTEHLFNSDVLGKNYFLASHFADIDWEHSTVTVPVKNEIDGYKQVSGGKIKIDFTFEKDHFKTIKIEWDK